MTIWTRYGELYAYTETLTNLNWGSNQKGPGLSDIVSAHYGVHLKMFFDDDSDYAETYMATKDRMNDVRREILASAIKHQMISSFALGIVLDDLVDAGVIPAGKYRVYLR